MWKLLEGLISFGRLSPMVVEALEPLSLGFGFLSFTHLSRISQGFISFIGISSGEGVGHP